MTAATLLARARDAGLYVSAVAGEIRLRASAPPPPDLLADLRAHKAEVLTLLAAGDPDAAAERAAIEAEPPLPAPGTPERGRQDAHRAAAIAGLLAAAAIRPPSWWHPDPHDPAPGATCSCCRGRDWWTWDRLGWCCAVCHPKPGTGRKPDGEPR